ncbi:capsid protein [RNA virus hoopoe/BBanka01/2015/HUN]|nr:capsid protein [RNA virus hoopoe/BBanka01/2015/HUN]
MDKLLIYQRLIIIIVVITANMFNPRFNRNYRRTAFRMGAPGFWNPSRIAAQRPIRNARQLANRGETIQTYDIPLGSIKKEGGAFALGPDQTVYQNLKYGVDALSWNNYHVKSVSIYWITNLNETNAAGQIAVWLTMDPSAKVPTTDAEILAQVSAAGKLGDIFFSSDKKYDQSNRLLLKTPLGNQVNYQTGQGDAASGAAYQEQGRLMVAVVGAQSSIESYGIMFMAVTVGWSTPGAPNKTGTYVKIENPVAKEVWTQPYNQMDVIELIWTNAEVNEYASLVIETSTNYRNYPVRNAVSAKTLPTFRSVQEDSGLTNTTNLWWAMKNLPSKGPTGKTIQVQQMAWDEENDEWVVNKTYGLPVYLTSKLVLERVVDTIIANRLEKLMQEKPVKVNQADLEGVDVIPAEVKIVEQPVDVNVVDQPIKTEVTNMVDTKILDPITTEDGVNYVNVKIPDEKGSGFWKVVETIGEIAAIAAYDEQK